MTLIRLRLRALRSRLGRRGAALLVFAYIDYVFGRSLLDPTLRAQTQAVPVYRALVDIAPLVVWGWLWLLVGVVCTVQAPMRDDRWAFALAIGIKVAWAGGMAYAWVVFQAPRALLSATLWAGLAILLIIVNGWPEPGADHVPRTDGPL